MTKTNVLLTGPIGSGKTSALATIPAAGHRLLTLACEPGIDKILTHGDLCHWHYIAPARTSWDVMERNANLVNTMDNGQLQKMRFPDNREYRQFIEMLTTCASFECDVCGENFGAVDALPEEGVFAVDGLSGVSIMSMDLVVGGKPIKTQADWGVAMDNVEKLIAKLCVDTKCSFVLTAHVDRNQDLVTGGTKIMVATLGQKLAPKIPRFFDEVVFCRRQSRDYYWSTIENDVDLKSRRLPLSDEIAPDFAQLLGDSHANT